MEDVDLYNKKIESMEISYGYAKQKREVFKLLVFIILFPYIFLLNVSNKLAILGQGYQI